MLRMALWIVVAAIAVWAHRRHRIPRDDEVPRVLAWAGAACLAAIGVEYGLRMGLASLPAVAPLLQIPVSLALWAAIAWLVACGTRRRDLFIRVPLLAATFLSGAAGAEATALVVLGGLATWAARWPRVLSTRAKLRVAAAALALLLLSLFLPAGPETQVAGTARTLGVWALGMARVAACLAFLAAFFSYARDPSLGIRTVSRRLAVSHVLVAAVPLLLLATLWGVTTVLGTNGGQATIAARQVDSQCAELRGALEFAIERPNAARAALAALVRTHAERWPGLAAWVVTNGRVERIAGAPLPEEDDLAGWTGALASLPASGAVLLPSGGRLGAAARSRLDSTLAAVVLAPADSVLARVPARVSGARLRLQPTSVSMAGGALRVAEPAPRRARRPAGELPAEDSLLAERIRRVTRQFGIPDSVVRAGATAEGGMRVTAGGDTIGAGASGTGFLFQGHAMVSGVLFDGGRWRHARLPISAFVPPIEVLFGLYRGVSENPFSLVPAILILSIGVMFAIVVWFDLRVVASVGRGINAVVFALRDAAARLQAGDLAHRIEVRGNDDLWNVASALNHAAAGLAEAREREKERERMESELAVARTIHARLLPGAPPRKAGLEIAGLSESAREVGGDYYDHLDLGGSRVLLVIADVSGKGVPAALLMSAFRASLASQDLAVADPAGIARKLNEFLVHSVEPGRFVTAFLGILDGANGRLVYTNAGHNPPLILRRDGSHETLEQGGLIFGVLPGGAYVSAQATLGPGDIVVLFTDGVTEGANAAGELWGDDRLLAAARRLAGQPCAAIAGRIAGEVRGFEGEQGPADDITLLVARRTADADSAPPSV